MRARYGIASDTFVVGFIGKVSPGRGFEEAIEAFSLLPAESRSKAVLLIIGHGPHRPFLEKLTRSLHVADRVIWAGYHEHDLPSHYRTMDLLLFTAPGSDEGHRAVIEALGCGTQVAAYPIHGISAVMNRADMIIPSKDARQLAGTIASAMRGGRTDRRVIAASVDRFDYGASAARLRTFYETLGRRSGS